MMFRCFDFSMFLFFIVLLCALYLVACLSSDKPILTELNSSLVPGLSGFYIDTVSGEEGQYFRVDLDNNRRYKTTLYKKGKAEGTVYFNFMQLKPGIYVCQYSMKEVAKTFHYSGAITILHANPDGCTRVLRKMYANRSLLPDVPAVTSVMRNDHSSSKYFIMSRSARRFPVTSCTAQTSNRLIMSE